MTRYLDLLERSAWTFVQAFAASVVLTNGLGLGDLKIATGAAVLSVLKSRRSPLLYARDWSLPPALRGRAET